MNSSKFIKTLFLIIFLISLAFNLFILVIISSLGFSLSGTLLYIIFSTIVSSLLIINVITITSPVIIKFIAGNQAIKSLGNTNHPLLKRLSKEAPGTYHHSTAVAEIAEKAVKVIGLSGTQIRIGAYYHDIGKLINPNVFNENQSLSSTKEEISEHQKAILLRKIISHVENGIEIAAKGKMPDEIIELIGQHHGTSIASSYQKELALTHGDTEIHRYPGPKPLTKEAGILMITDSCEAKARSSKTLSAKTIPSIVESIIRDKISDDQLELCTLSDIDLGKIKKSIISSLESIYHKRISY